MRLFCLLLTATLLTSSISSNDFFEVPNEYIEDAILKAEENVSSALEGLDENSSDPESAEENNGDTIYNFNLDTENIMNRLDGIDNKLSMLNALSNDSNYSYLSFEYIVSTACSASTNSIIINNSYVLFYCDISSLPSNSVFYFDCSATSSIFRIGFSNSLDIGSPIYELARTFSGSIINSGYKYLVFSRNGVYEFMPSTTVYYVDDSDNPPDVPENPGVPDNPPSGDDSNILDALNTQTGYLISLSKKIDSLILITFILTFVPMLQRAIHKIMFKKGD